MMRLLLSELLDMAAGMGALKEGQRTLEKRQDSIEARIGTMETTILQTSFQKAPKETATPWWHQLLPPDTLPKLLVWLAPKLLLIGTLLWQWIKQVFQWLWHAI